VGKKSAATVNAKVSRATAGIPRRAAFLAVILLAGAAIVFGRVKDFEFTNLDDSLYIARNPYIQGGLTAGSLGWAFSADLFYDSPNADRWQPLVFLSRMADIQFFGLNAGAHHVVNLVFHALNMMLLLWFFRRLGADFWKSALAVFIFAFHPVQVEPVAWLTARKDLLSVFFALLTFHAYLSSLRRPSAGRKALVALAFACALMSKSMMIPLPFLLLVLDFWPLGRLNWEDRPLLVRRIREKMPLWILALVFIPVPFLGVPSALSYAKPFHVLAGALTSYFFYLRKWFWPADLGFYGPQQAGSVNPAVLAAAALGAALLAVGAWKQRKLRPHLTAAWLWYTASISPVLGLEFPGDRFLYLPTIGLAAAVAWETGCRLKTRRGPAFAVSAAAMAGVFVLPFLSFAQTATWRTSETLFHRALEVNPRNYLAMNDLGVYYEEKGRHAEASEMFSRALGVSSKQSDLYNNMGTVLFLQGKNDEALEYFKKSVDLNPYNPRAQNNIGNILVERQDFSGAEGHYSKALEMQPGYTHAYNNKGVLLSREGKPQEALDYFKQAVASDKQNAVAEKNWANALVQLDRREESLAHFARAVEINPDDAEGWNNLGATFSELGRHGEALPYYLKALEKAPRFATAYYNAGHACLLTGQNQAARDFFSRALALKPDYEKAKLGLTLLDEASRNPPAGGGTS